MTYGQSLLPEFDQEMASTRKLLALIPEDKWEWKAHAKANSVGWVANHLVEIVGWTAGTIANPVWEIAPADGEPYASPSETTVAGALGLFDKNVAEARQALEKVSDEKIQEMWSLTKEGVPLFTMPKGVVIRTWVLNHLIHHRAHLCVYLRMLGIAIPGMYGPSGDETAAF